MISRMPWISQESLENNPKNAKSTPLTEKMEKQNIDQYSLISICARSSQPKCHIPR